MPLLPHKFAGQRPESVTPILAILGAAVLVAIVTAMRVPVQFPMPGYFVDIRLWAANGQISDTFTPLAYPLFAAPAYLWAGTAGIAGLQAMLYVATVATSIWLLRQLSLPLAWAGVGCLTVLLHPEFVSSIPKVWDVDLSVFLLLLFIALCLRLQRFGPSAGLNLSLGLVLGAGVFCRPNYALLVVGLLFALWTSGTGTGVMRGLCLLVVGLAASGVFALCGIASHGSPFLPRNGPYNLFAGNNPYSTEALLERLNAEPSLPAAFKASYPPPLPDLSAPDAYYRSSYEEFYSRQALRFVEEHPGEELRLIGIKLFTLFRPDTKVHPLRSLAGLGKLILALPSVLFLLLLVLPGRSRLGREDWLLLLVCAAYVLPFLLTNSDPRFRLPLDALLLLHCVRLSFLRIGDATALRDGRIRHASGESGGGAKQIPRQPSEAKFL